MIAGVPKEVGKGERRVALVPESIARLKGLGIVIERGAGEGAGFPDSGYVESGASTASDAKALYQQAEIILKVQPPTEGEVGLFREGSTIISFLYPLSNIPAVKALASRGVTAFAMDLMPRISRAQSMDALSSQATVAGYKAVMLAADALPKLFPLLMTAAGTIAPARVFVLGAGVAGLQAIATARRLGALVEAYDVRPAVKEQVESIGARFVEVPLEVKDAQTAGGYAKAQSDEFYRRQQELLAEHTGAADVVITTALVPGKRAPLLISEDSVKRMRPGSVIVDLAAEQGGNCALTEPGKSVVKYGVTILGPTNVPSSMAPEASQLYSRNITTFLGNMLKDGKLNLDMNDELVRGPMVVHEGKVVHDQTRAAMEGASAA
ncbi:MAG: Re/Si-specific NAD(P)(+) transhydrogenase subunit alpha [Nitrososphaerales archaeon]|nr:Re/Si-specific NAD(P)(+) transhydrogenase subunit alpha [Nitrososphaerales archaeon]